MENLVVVKNATKKFEDIIVLDTVNLSFEKGKIHGIIGRNGSGKTVLLKCIAGLTPLTEGETFVKHTKLNYELMYPIKIGIIIENPGFLPNYSGFKNLKMLAAINNAITSEEIKAAMKAVDLDCDSKKHVSKYSLGMKQKLGLAQALMENPEILILDEPMNGIDVESIKKIHTLLKELTLKGTTILIATHFKEEIEMLCDTITHIDNGHIVSSTCL